VRWLFLWPEACSLQLRCELHYAQTAANGRGRTRPMDPQAQAPLDLREAFRGREVMVTGVTGFLGKVALAMLLDRYPEVGRVHVRGRPRAGGAGDERFSGKVAPAPPFDPLRARHGDRFEQFLRDKCAPLAGDVTDPLFGLTEAQVAQMAGKLA